MAELTLTYSLYNHLWVGGKGFILVHYIMKCYILILHISHIISPFNHMQLWDQLTNIFEMRLGAYPMAILLLAGDFSA